MKTVSGIVAALALAALAGPLAGPADARPTSAVPVLELAQRDCLTLGEAIERVRRQYDGRIVNAETRRQGNREMHHIRVMTENGVVKTVRIPGCSLDSRG